jgi:L,D-transpeptidase YcbB
VNLHVRTSGQRDARWPEPALQQAIATGATRRIRVARPLPVLIFYRTAEADPCGDLHLHRDVYGRDAALLRKLDGH